MNEDWDWVFTARARRDFESLAVSERDRLSNRLDEIVEHEWRDPIAFLEPLSGASHSKLRIGQFRLGCRADVSTSTLYVLRIKRRGGDAYRDDD